MNPARRALAVLPLACLAPAGRTRAGDEPALRRAMQRAVDLRDQAVRAGDQAYGAVVLDGERIVGDGPSRVVARGDASAHAEREALADAQRRLGRSELIGLLLVSTSRPCAMCQAAANRAGVAGMVWGASLDVVPPALVQAAAAGDLATVQRLLVDGVPVNQRDRSGRNALLAATQGGHVPAAAWLIARGADVNAQDSQQDSAFLLAGARGHTEIVRLALAAGADVTRLNRYGGTALIPACHYGHVETVKLLLESSRTDVNHINRLGWTALLEAVILGDGSSRYQEIVRLLLAHRADPNRADREGVTPLAHARQRAQDAVAALLVAAGAR